MLDIKILHDVSASMGPPKCSVTAQIGLSEPRLKQHCSIVGTVHGHIHALPGRPAQLATMGIFGKSKSKQFKCDMFVHVHTLSPWPAQYNKLVLEWQRGGNKKGWTKPVGPTVGQPGRLWATYEIEDTFHVPCTLYQVQPFRSIIHQSTFTLAAPAMQHSQFIPALGVIHVMSDTPSWWVLLNTRVSRWAGIPVSRSCTRRSSCASRAGRLMLMTHTTWPQHSSMPVTCCEGLMDCAACGCPYIASFLLVEECSTRTRTRR